MNTVSALAERKFENDFGSKMGIKKVHSTGKLGMRTIEIDEESGKINIYKKFRKSSGNLYCMSDVDEVSSKGKSVIFSMEKGPNIEVVTKKLTDAIVLRESCKNKITRVSSLGSISSGEWIENNLFRNY